MKKPKQVYCDLYRQNIFVFYRWSEKDFNRYMSKHYEWNLHRLGDGYTIHMTNGKADEFVVWVTEKPLEKADEILIHEIIHLKNLIFRYVGVQLSLENDEHEAYYTQKLFRQCRG